MSKAAPPRRATERKPNPLFEPGSPLFWIVTLLATCAGVVFVVLSLRIAFFGTGAEIPVGADVVEGTLVETRLTDSPVGEPFLVGEVTLGSPGGSGIVDHRWRGPAGDQRVRVETAEGEAKLHVPSVGLWRGRAQTEDRVVQHLDSLPIVSTVDLSEAQLAPPYAVAGRALRPGDTIIAKLESNFDANSDTIYDVVELYVGSRDELEADLTQRESMRFPIVGMLFIVGLGSLVVARKAWLRARA